MTYSDRSADPCIRSSRPLIDETWPKATIDDIFVVKRPCVFTDFPALTRTAHHDEQPPPSMSDVG
jgi:hypothetical protein